MDITKGDIIKLYDKKYIIIEKLNYKYEQYAFVNELTKNEDIGEHYYILKIINDTAVKITDEKFINLLMEKFKNILKEDIDDIIKINES